MKHVRLTDITRKDDNGVGSVAKQDADKVADEGGSPRAQLDAARSRSSSRLSYNAHVGARQGQRNLERLTKKCLPCPICFGVEDCTHTFEERQKVF